MFRKLSWLMLGAITLVVAGYVTKSLATPATPPPGFVSMTLAQGRFGQIDVFNRLINPDSTVWLSLQKTQGDSDVYVQSNTWQPGADTGWHRHPGHSLITV